MKRRRWALSIAAFLAFCFPAESQNHTALVRGVVTEEATEQSLFQAAVMILSPADSSLISGIATGIDGRFSIDAPEGGSIVKVSMLGFCDRFINVAVTDSTTSINLGNIALKADPIALESAVVSAKAPVVTVVEDTLVYNPAAFRLPEDAMLDDLLKKIPGLEVNGGTITLHGKEISDLYVDGKRFFGGNVKTGLKSLSADMIDKVNAYERESDFARISGIEDDEKEPVLDIKIKPNKMKGWHNRIGLGYGTEGRYNARFNSNRITKKKQTTIILTQRNIASQAGINTTSRNQIGTGAAGDRTTREAGVNFGKYTKTLELNGSVHYDGNERDAESRSRVQNISSSSQSFTNNNADIYSMLNKAKADLTLEWKPNKNNTLYVKPEFSYNGTGNKAKTDGSYFISDPYAIVPNPNDWIGFDIPDDPLKSIRSNSTDNLTHNYNDIFQGVITLTATHRFAKKGRSLSFRTKDSYYGNTDNQFNSYLTRYYRYKKNPDSLLVRKLHLNSFDRVWSFMGQLSYNEPLGGGFHLQLTARSERSIKTSQRDLFFLQKIDPLWLPPAYLGRKDAFASLPENYQEGFDPSFSYDARYEYMATTIITSMRFVRKKFNITVGATFRPLHTRLTYTQNGENKESLNKDFQIAPNVTLKYLPQKNRSLLFNYRNWASMPSVYNLVEVASGTNPLYVHIGNPNLKPVLVHNLNLTYNFSDLKTQSSLTIDATGRFEQGKISDMATYDPESGSRVTRPENVDGNWRANLSVVYNKTFNDSRWSLSNHLNGEFQNNMSYLYDSKLKEAQLNHSSRFMVKERFDGYFRNSWLESDLTLRVDYTNEKSELRPDMNQEPTNFSAGLSNTFTLPWKMRLNIEYIYMLQRGWSYEELNRDYHIINASIAQPILKNKATIKLEAEDALGQLINLTRNFGAQSRSVVTYNGIDRYLMLRFIYRFTVK